MLKATPHLLLCTSFVFSASKSFLCGFFSTPSDRNMFGNLFWPTMRSCTWDMAAAMTLAIVSLQLKSQINRKKTQENLVGSCEIFKLGKHTQTNGQRKLSGISRAHKSQSHLIAQPKR